MNELELNLKEMIIDKYGSMKKFSEVYRNAGQHLIAF